MKPYARLLGMALAFTGGITYPIPSHADPVPGQTPVVVPAAAATVPLFRLYQAMSSGHLYTTSQSEAQAAAGAGYSLEGAIGGAPAAGPGAAPVYRLYNPASDDHFYTASQAEAQAAAGGDGYVSEGVGFQVYAQSGAGLLPLYRLYQPSGGHHFYTTSQAEHDGLVGGGGWNDEGVLGYLAAPARPAPATASNPPAALVPAMADFTSPANLSVHSTWQGAPSDTLTWDAVPGAASYNVYQYDQLIAKGVTGTSYTVPASVFNGFMTYSVTAVDSDCACESLPSAIAGAGGVVDPNNVPSWVSQTAPPAPGSVTAVPEWNAGSPRVHLAWSGDGSAQVYSVYRDGQKVATGLWGLSWFDDNVKAGETHAYSVTGVNTFWPGQVEGAMSASVSATAPAAAPAALGIKVQIVRTLANDDGVTVFFNPIPGVADYRVYSTAKPGTVKYAGAFGTGQSGDMIKNGIPALPAPDVLSIEMNGLDPNAGADLVVEAVDKLGPFQKMDGSAGPGAMQMDGTMSSAINGQGDPSDVPNVLATSGAFHVTCQPRVLAGSQVFFDTFRGEQPLTTATPEPAVAAESNAFSEVKDMENDKWRIRTIGADTQMTQAFFMGNHFMDTLYDGPTAKAAFSHNNNASLVMMPKATADISGGKVLHVTFEVDAHFDSRRWCDLFVGEAGDPLLHAAPQKLDGNLPTVKGNLFVWEITAGSHTVELVQPKNDGSGKNTLTDLFQPLPNNYLDTVSMHRDIYAQVFNAGAWTNGSAQSLDKRSRFDLYLSQTHYKIVETEPDGVTRLTREKDFPAGASLPFTNCQVYFTHELYHTGNDRPENLGDPNSAYWVNERPYSDERHWDNMGFSVLDAFPQQ